ncbi:MAG: radical SAM protein, partial [Spirochaetaceae bacterium]
RSRVSEPFFCARYALSPYRGCGHGCLYCDGRAEKYYVEGDFVHDVEDRTWLPDALDADLRSVREKAFVSLASGVSDVYQPRESRLELTRRCAEILARHRFPAVVATKSNLVLRDLDVWTNIAHDSGFLLLTSIAILDEKLRSDVEPGASSIGERFEMLASFKAAGCATGVLAMPVLPGLSDDDDALDELFHRCAELGVDCVIPGNLTLRPGRQKELFLMYIARCRPDLVPLYRRLYAEERASGNTEYGYREALYRRFADLGAKHRMPPAIPHSVFAGRIGVACELHLVLSHMVTLYKNRGSDTQRLETALDRYRKWLDRTRVKFNRRRSLEPSWVNDEVRLTFDDPARATELLGNEKLAAFATRILHDRAVLDYRTLELGR